MNRLVKITFSPTGGTQKVTDYMAETFSGEIVEATLLKEESISIEKEDFVMIAVPSFSGRVPKTAAERIAKLQGNGAKCILIVVYGNREYEDTLLELKNIAKEAGFEPVAAAAALAEHSMVRTVAAGRPDETDRNELAAFGEKVFASVDTLSEVVVPGNEEYRAYGKAAMDPQPTEDCLSCGTCLEGCPVGAIGEDFRSNPEVCISCMRCLSICPNQSRKPNPNVMEVVTGKLGPLAGIHKENEFFLN